MSFSREKPQSGKTNSLFYSISLVQRYIAETKFPAQTLSVPNAPARLLGAAPLTRLAHSASLRSRFSLRFGYAKSSRKSRRRPNALFLGITCFRLQAHSRKKVAILNADLTYLHIAVTSFFHLSLQINQTAVAPAGSPAPPPAVSRFKCKHLKREIGENSCFPQTLQRLARAISRLSPRPKGKTFLTKKFFP